MQSNITDIPLNLSQHKLNIIVDNIERDFLSDHALNYVTTGFEQEFYLSCVPSSDVLQKLAEIDGIAEVKSELGENQFEITTIPQIGFVKSCDIIVNFRKKAQHICNENDMKISFLAVAKSNNPPSSLQLSVVFYEENREKSLDYTHKTLHKIVQNAVGNLPYVTILTSQTENCFERIANYAFVRQFKNSPTHATWGVENRTVAIRIAKIPDGSRRLEYRTPSSCADPHRVAIAFLLSAIIKTTQKYPQTFVDSCTSNEPHLPRTNADAIRIFSGSYFEKKLQYYLQKHGI